MNITNENPEIDFIHALDLNERYLNGDLPPFDIFISYSSLEHGGLGRYGDNLNPWGDLIAMARAWCLLKPGSLALIGVPTGPIDKIVFNSHRIYGPIMYSHLFANWKLIWTEIDYSKHFKHCDYCYQPLTILKRNE